MAQIEIRKDVPLKPFTTFKVGGPARYFACATTQDDFLEALRFARRHGQDVFLLGGGSNILVSDEGFPGLVIHPAGRGITIRNGESEKVTISIEAGEPWDNVVARAVGEGFWGIESLSHIPGQAGAAIVQNIGAYGQQISDVFKSATVMQVATGNVLKAYAADCGFGYRRSIFNSGIGNDLAILQIELVLSRLARLDLRYPDVRDTFKERGIERPTIQQVRDAIIEIRDRKFPYPLEEKGGNAGSFFKNLVMSEEEFEVLRANVERNFSMLEGKRLDEIHNRSGFARTVKIPTAFLIDICGLKGHCEGGARVNENQPLVLLNNGGATADDVLMLAGCIRRTVYARTGMTLQLEPELVGFRPEEVEKYLALD